MGEITDLNYVVPKRVHSAVSKYKMGSEVQVVTSYGFLPNPNIGGVLQPGWLLGVCLRTGLLGEHAWIGLSGSVFAADPDQRLIDEVILDVITRLRGLVAQIQNGQPIGPAGPTGLLGPMRPIPPEGEQK